MAKRLILLLCFASVISLMLSCSRGGEEPKRTDSTVAPSFVLTDSNGNKIDLADYRGKVVILEFFATWCEPCRISAPELQVLQKRYKDKGVTVIAISFDEGPDTPAKVRSFMKEYGLSYIHAIDSGQVRKQYEAFVLPTTVIIDGEGKIRNRHLGVTADYAKRLSAEIEPLLK